MSSTTGSLSVPTPFASLVRQYPWELLLVVILAGTIAYNLANSTNYLGIDNLVNLFELSIEKVIIVVMMAFLVIAGEIDLSVASMMGLSAAVLAKLHESTDVPFGLAVVAAVATGAVAGMIQGWCVAKLGIPSLVVTLAGLIGLRGAARIFVEDRSIGDFPSWFSDLGQDGLIGPVPLSLLLFFAGLTAGIVVLGRTAFGRRIYVLGDNAEVARYSGLDVDRTRIGLFVASGTVAALAGVLYASRLGSVRGDMANGFELDIVTMVLLGGVSIFGGSGTMVGVGLAVFIVLNVRNGLGLANVEANVQTGIIGAILIVSVLVRNSIDELRTRGSHFHAGERAGRDPAGGAAADVNRPRRTHMRKHNIGAIVVAAVAVGTAVGSVGASTVPVDSGAAGSTAPAGSAAPAGDAVVLEPGMEFNSILLPKFTGIAVFDQANEGAQEAAAELGTTPAEFLGPTADNSVAGQIEIMTNAATQGVDAVMLSNNAGDQIVPAVQAAVEAGVDVVTWDSPIPSAEGESVFVAQVDFDETGQVMADMARSILGDDGGELAILSASPDAANQNAWIAAFEEVLATPEYENLVVVDTVYGNDESEESYNQALALVDQNPDLELIMSPTTVGIAAAAKAMQDEGLCEDVKISGLGLPDEMREYTESGCAPAFALWSFVDLGYLTYYVAYGVATEQIEAAEGTTFEAGRMGTYSIETDPTRDAGLRVLMGPFTVYTAENIDG